MVFASQGRFMSALSSNQTHWLQRAQEARAMAEQLADREARQAMLEIAENYEKIAKRAEAREVGVPMPASPQKL